MMARESYIGLKGPGEAPIGISDVKEMFIQMKHHAWTGPAVKSPRRAQGLQRGL
jgi:hypothetical protein